MSVTGNEAQEEWWQDEGYWDGHEESGRRSRGGYGDMDYDEDDADFPVGAAAGGSGSADASYALSSASGGQERTAALEAQMQQMAAQVQQMMQFLATASQPVVTAQVPVHATAIGGIPSTGGGQSQEQTVQPPPAQQFQMNGGPIGTPTIAGTATGAAAATVAGSEGAQQSGEAEL